MAAGGRGEKGGEDLRGETQAQAQQKKGWGRRG